MLDVAASLALTFLIAYPSLWAQSFDPNFIVEIYGQHDLNGPSNFLTDEDPPLFSLGAAGWTCALFVASSESETHCSLNMSNLSSIDGLVGVLAVAVTGKCLIGSAGVTHKRMLLGSNGKLTRPFSWRLLDVISPIPTNLSVKVFNKLVWFPVFAGVSWVFDLFASEKLTDKLIIPDYAFLALAFLFIGRLSTIYQHREQLSFAEHIGLRARSLGGRREVPDVF